jgi:hypothetical protein
MKEYVVGSSDFDKSFENCYAHVVLDWRKILVYEIVLEKAFFFIL